VGFTVYKAVDNSLRVNQLSLAELNTMTSLEIGSKDTLTLLWDLDHAKCSNPRDRIHSIYMLTNGLVFEDMSVPDDRHYRHGHISTITDYALSFEAVGIYAFCSAVY
jgi:hypothetical protein